MTKCDERKLPEPPHEGHPLFLHGVVHSAGVHQVECDGGVKSFESLMTSVMLEVDISGNEEQQEADDIGIDIIREVLSQSHNGGLLHLNWWREGSDFQLPLLLSSEQILLLPQDFQVATVEISAAVREVERERRSGAELIADLRAVVEVAYADVAADLSTPCGTERLGPLVLGLEELRLNGGVAESAVGVVVEPDVGSREVIQYFDLIPAKLHPLRRSCDYFNTQRAATDQLLDEAKVVELIIGDLLEWAMKTRRFGVVELLRYCKTLLRQAMRERDTLEAATQALGYSKANPASDYSEAGIQVSPIGAIQSRNLQRSSTETHCMNGCRDIVEGATGRQNERAVIAGPA
jgi:hypothetical protein